MKGHDAFVGTEAEGRWRGVPTYFVPLVRDRSRMHQGTFQYTFPAMAHVYIGAGGHTLTNRDELEIAKKIVEENPLRLITIEISVSILREALVAFALFNHERLRLLVSIPVSHPFGLHRDNIEIKLDYDGGCAVYDQLHAVGASSDLYKEDKKLA